MKMRYKIHDVRYIRLDKRAEIFIPIKCKTSAICYIPEKNEHHMKILTIFTENQNFNNQNATHSLT